MAGCCSGSAMAEQWEQDAVNTCSGLLAVMCMQQTAASVARYVVATDALPTRDSAGLNHHYAMILAMAYLELAAASSVEPAAVVREKGELDDHAPVDRQNGS